MTARSLAIGRSALRWDGGRLVADIDERTTPFGQRLRGRVAFTPAREAGVPVDLDGHGRHVWTPVAPAGRIEVDFSEPHVAFSGLGYHDENCGAEPLEAAFREWSWSRASSPNADAFVAYDVVTRAGEERSLSFLSRGGAPLVEARVLDRRELPMTRWRVRRAIRCDQGADAHVARELEDGPFYSRSLVRAVQHGVRVTAVHESLSLDRLDAPWARFLSRFRTGQA